MKRIKPGGKQHDPAFKALIDSSASFAIKPAMNGYKGAVRTTFIAARCGRMHCETL
jgi:hypothetical protein